MAYIARKGAVGYPNEGATVNVYLAGTTNHATGLTNLDGGSITSPYTIPVDANTEFWGFEPSDRSKLDIKWTEGNKYLVRNAILKDPYQASDVGAVPTSRTINGKPLTSDIVIDIQGGLATSYVFCEDVIFAGTSPVWHELESGSDGGAVGSHAATTDAFTELDRYVTEPLGTDTLPPGTWVFSLFAGLSATNREGQLRAQIYRVDSAGAIVGSVLGTATSATFTNNTVASINLSAYIAEQTGWELTDRIGIVISGKRGVVAATLTFYHDASSGYVSSVQSPISLLHNHMSGLNQGEYQHLTTSEKSKAIPIIYLCSGDSTITLPTCSSGIICYAVVDVATAMTVTSNTGDKFLHIDGSESTSAESLVSEAEIGCMLKVIGIDSTYWLVEMMRGTWT